MPNQLNIIPNSNDVTISTTQNKVVVVDPSQPANIEVTQPVTRVIQVAAGPQGLKGDPGPQGSQGERGFSIFTEVGTNTFSTTSSLQVTGSLTVSGSSTFTNIGPTVFIGPVTVSDVIIANIISGTFSGSGAGLVDIPAAAVTGLSTSAITSGSYSASISETGLQINTTVIATSFSGAFSGSGANLFAIPSTAIVGLNLSQISSGSVSASISPSSGLQINTQVTATSFTGSLFGTASWATNYTESDPIFTSRSASLATTGSNTFIGNQTISGILTVTGSTNLTNTTGTTIFSSNADTLTITGSLLVTGSVNVVGLITGTGSYALTASYIDGGFY